jgi:hypothetical protein
MRVQRQVLRADHLQHPVAGYAGFKHRPFRKRATAEIEYVLGELYLHKASRPLYGSGASRNLYPADPVRYGRVGEFQRIGSLARPVGGWLSDKTEGARVTFWNFLVMALGGGIRALLPLIYGPLPYRRHRQRVYLSYNPHHLPHRARTRGRRRRRGREGGGSRQGQKDNSFVLGFAGAIAAYGGFVIPQA